MHILIHIQHNVYMQNQCVFYRSAMLEIYFLTCSRCISDIMKCILQLILCTAVYYIIHIYSMLSECKNIFINAEGCRNGSAKNQGGIYDTRPKIMA